MSIEDSLHALSRVRFFAGFEENQLRLLAFGGETIDLGVGQRLYTSGKASDGGYVVLDGNVDHYSGGRHSVISSHGRASLLGEMALITETQHSATAFATTPTRLLKISRHLFHRMLQEYPSLATKLQAQIKENLDGFIDQLEVVQQKLDRAETFHAPR